MTERHGSRPARPDSLPAPTLTGSALGAGAGPAPSVTAIAGSQWHLHRPSPTICADPRIGAPGHHDTEHRHYDMSNGAMRLTEADALRLQSFPADYPVQGNRTSRFRQIGNAIPPGLAHAILRAVT